MTDTLAYYSHSVRVSPQLSNRLVAAARSVLNRYIPDVYIYTDVYRGEDSGKWVLFSLLPLRTPLTPLLAHDQIPRLRPHPPRLLHLPCSPLFRILLLPSSRHCLLISRRLDSPLSRRSRNPSRSATVGGDSKGWLRGSWMGMVGELDVGAWRGGCREGDGCGSV